MSIRPDGSGETTDAALTELENNVQKIEDLSQRLISILAHRRQVPAALQGPGQDLYVKGMTAYWSEMMHNPARIFEQQVSYWGKTLTHYMEAQQALADGFKAPEDDTPSDRRFSSELWRTHPYFNFIKQQYLLNAEALREAVDGLDDMEPAEKKRLSYFTQQIIDMMSPTNFLATNPDALAKAAESEGRSLVAGLENLVADLEANQGELLVTLADKDAFTVGENIATTPGKVVFRNHLFELIQYAPTTDKVHTTPLIVFPPWINKFYILDLKPQNSFVKWVVDQGFTLFVVSWRNPDPSYADVGMDTYIEDGFLTAIGEAKRICNVKTVNAVGYCIAGTTLSMTLALMKARGDKSVKSATFFTMLTDFADQGEFSAFLTPDFMAGITEEARRVGMLDSFYMTRTFSYLRANDLIYTPAIKSYMLGEAPPAFDLLYWNGDSTNLPGRMAVEYLESLCRDNLFVDGGVEFCGETLRIEDVTIPLCAIACETDHIAPWRNSYSGVARMGSKDKTFIVSESGHIAGIVNPPSKNKYGHYTNEAWPEASADWIEGATRHDGSWWPRWGEWLASKSGRKVNAREPADDLGDAPGSYVRL